MRSKRNLLGGGRAPVALTGAGLVSAAGLGLHALRGGLHRQASCLRPLDPRSGSTKGPWRQGRLDPGSVGGQVADDILSGWSGLRAGDDRAVPLAALAMEEALRASGFPGRPGLVLGTALGPVGVLEGLVDSLGDGGGRGPETLEPAPFAFETFASRLAEELPAVSGPPPQGRPLRGRARGGLPSKGVISEQPAIFSVTCVSGLCAIEQAAADLAFGRHEAVLAGGFDTLTGFMHGGFRSLAALSSGGRLKPFGLDHDGILIGEAACFLLLETLGAARERGGPIRGVLASQRLVSDAVHLTSPDPEGRGMAAAIDGALSDAGLGAEDIGCITVTAAGSAVYDRMQSTALEAALGPRAARRIPVTTWEALTGHALAATGTLGVAHASLVLEDGRVPAVPASGRIDPECRLRYVIGEPAALRSPSVLALTVGFGGLNGATLVLSAEMAADLAGTGGGLP